jgi:hypothetical protein
MRIRDGNYNIIKEALLKRLGDTRIIVTQIPVLDLQCYHTVNHFDFVELRFT